MIKIAALNDESEEESGSEEEVTKEALEQIALQQYAKALELQRKGNLKDATQLLKDLLDTELLYDIKKPAQGEKISGPLLNLKYLCYKNLATILSSSDVDAAIDCYCSASELDDTDVTLWHRLGQLCMRGKRYEMALHAFQRGADRNPRHWPCLDKIVTILMGLDFKEECISAIYDTLQLDPGYLRGLAYRKHIYTSYPYVRDFMEYLNPMYKWNEKDDDPIDEDDAQKLIKEAEEIHEVFIEQQREQKHKYILPHLKLQKPINNLNWNAVGESLIHMHKYISDNFYSHACFIDIIFEKEEKQEPMDLFEEPKAAEVPEKSEENAESDKNNDVVSENDNELSDKDKPTTDTEKVESDIETPATETPSEAQPEAKTQKKQPVRRRGSALSFLQQWEWCTKRRSARKKPTTKSDRFSDNIYDTLRRMVPPCLTSENSDKKATREPSPDVGDLDKFDERGEPEKKDDDYFGTEMENNDVQQFINKYIENKKDIIDILNDYLSILAAKWRVKWPEGLSTIFIECNKCYNNHIDVPACTGDNHDGMVHYTAINILVEEFLVNDKLNTSSRKETHALDVIESIGMILTMNPHIFTGTDCLEYMLRYLWVKVHISIINKCEEFALDSLYQLSFEFEAMGEHCDQYSLDIINFTFKPIINNHELVEYIKFLERNKKLSTVMDLYDQGHYKEVLSIIIDSFDHCKTIAKKQEEEMSLDFAVQLSLILDTYWALEKVNECFKWSLTCLHEALKHYFRYTSGSEDYNKWNLAVVKILCCMEHILTTEGLICLDAVSQKEISQGVEDLIRIIGHQVETNATEMPFGTIIPWIVLHYILQREEDQGRLAVPPDSDNEDVPNPLMALFIGHQQLGNRGWCCNSDGKLLYFILDTVVPRIRSPALAKSYEQLLQHMEQCVFCLFGHPSRKSKIKYLADHNVTPHALDWHRAQQLYEIFRPLTLPELEGKVSAITADTEQLFHRILALLPSECEPHKYVPDIEKYIKGVESKLPTVPTLLPYKMKDIYFLLGDHYFKREEAKMAIKFNILDVIVNKDRLESWAQIALAKATNLERLLNSCKNLNNEKDFLIPARSIIRCFQRSLQLDPEHSNLWIEYGMFVYVVHSFCSRALKQASESLSMDDFASLEKQKEDMLDTTQKCFTTVDDLNRVTNENEKSDEESWLYFYMLGKVDEKRNKPPAVYLDHYSKAVKMLQKTDAIYPLKISYNAPVHLSIEVLELHYRIHASILKYIEQHENKPIPASVGKVFLNCIDEWRKGPFSRKSTKDREDAALESEKAEAKAKQNEPAAAAVQAANILKRSVSDAGEEDNLEAKRLKLEAAAAKVRRSASYDTERLTASKELTATAEPASSNEPTASKESAAGKELNAIKELAAPTPSTAPPVMADTSKILEQGVQMTEQKEETFKGTIAKETVKKTLDKPEMSEYVEEQKEKLEPEKKEESSSSSSSSSDSSSSDSTSDSSSSNSSRDSESSSKSANESKLLSEEETMKIIKACLYALEDCASRFPPHYKAIYRLAHYHFYFKKGKNIERCRDLMLSTFTASFGLSIGGLFSERRMTNFFNNIWKIPVMEVERAGGFAFHMNRCVLLTMEILKEIDDHKTLLDLSLQLQRIPEPDKRYLRDADREELAQQALSLSVQSLKGQVLKFSQQPDLKSNDIEQQALKSLMLDIYKSYQRTQKQSNSKQFLNLIIDAYKLITTIPITENTNLVDVSLKYCQSIARSSLKQLNNLDNLEKTQNAQKKPSAKLAAAAAEPTKAKETTTHSKPDSKVTSPVSTSTTASGSVLPKMSQHEMAAAFQNYLPMLNDPMLSQQTAAALSLSYLSNALAGYTSLQNTLQTSLQTSLQNSFQAEFYRQFLGQSFSPYNVPPPAKKQKRGPKPKPNPLSNTLKSSKSFSGTTSMSKSVSTNTTSSLQRPISNLPKPSSNLSKPSTSLQKSTSAPLAPSMGTVLSSLPASMTAGLTTYNPPPISSHSVPTQAHMSTSTASTVNSAIHTKPPLPHQQVSPGKTLQEKLAERQKNLPTMSKSTQNVSSQEINASISRLPSSLTITKTSLPKQASKSVIQGKKPEAKKALSFNEAEAKPKPKPTMSSDEVIVLDDD